MNLEVLNFQLRLHHLKFGFFVKLRFYKALFFSVRVEFTHKFTSKNQSVSTLSGHVNSALLTVERCSSLNLLVSMD